MSSSKYQTKGEEYERAGGTLMNIIDISVNFVYNNTKGDFVWLDINTARIPRK